ncbi:hypothetical protein [Streptomyces sp. NBC_01320]|uniref:hypothetical protein n=1 Tax=Streptomyces sp. NBC_01320 TaxID=2903824 RepID=UPI002E12E468|nr:hypothetical protein OG395_50440 [Streptomyces sp. NBC_01320]
MLRPKPDLARLTGQPAEAQAATEAAVDAPDGICGFGSEERYIRIARSRNSSGYFLRAAMVDVPLMRTI